MATVVQTPVFNNAAGGSVTSITRAFTSNVTAGNLLVVAVQLQNTPPYSAANGVTWTISDTLGNTYTQAVSTTGMLGTDVTHQRIFYTISGSGGANTVTATPSTTVNKAFIGVIEASGVDADSPVEATNNASGTGTTPSAGSVTMAGGGFAVAVLWDGYTNTINAGSGWTGYNHAGPYGPINVEVRTPTTGGTYTGNWTKTSGWEWVAAIVAFRDASASSIAPLGGKFQRSILTNGLVR